MVFYSGCCSQALRDLTMLLREFRVPFVCVGKDVVAMRKLLEQIMKFGVVGFLAFAIDYGVLMLLSQVLGMDPVLSAGISFCVSLVFNYLASMRFVFKHRDDMSRSREFVTFLILSAIGLGINEFIMWGGTALFGGSAIAVTAVKVFATAVVMVWNFVSRKKWLDAGE